MAWVRRVDSVVWGPFHWSLPAYQSFRGLIACGVGHRDMCSDSGGPPPEGDADVCCNECLKWVAWEMFDPCI